MARQAENARGARGPPFPVKAYLVVYNVVSTLGWAFVLILTLIHLFNLDNASDTLYAPAITPLSVLSRLLSTVHSRKTFTLLGRSFGIRVPAALQPIYVRATTTYARLGVQTAFVQSLAVLEVLHALVGWVRSPVGVTAMQVASRIFLVWGIADQYMQTRTNPLYATMVLAWSMTEVIRYSFYALTLLGYTPSMLLYLRYTTFYVLYPLGAAAEAFLMYATLPGSSPIPSWNSWVYGIWTPYDYIRALLFAIWWPGLYTMYTYMIQQRRKVFRRGSRESQVSKQE